MPKGSASKASAKKVDEMRDRHLRIVKCFKEFDKDGSGKLSTDEVIQILMRESGGKQLDEDAARDFIAQFDVNKDGELNITEFAEAFAKVEEGMKETKMSGLEWHMLKALDADGSGVLEVDELMILLTAKTGKAKGMSEADAREFISLFDKDGDGNIDPTEFRKFLRALDQGEGGDAGQKKIKDIAATRIQALQRAQSSRKKGK